MNVFLLSLLESCKEAHSLRFEVVPDTKEDIKTSQQKVTDRNERACELLKGTDDMTVY